MRELRRYRHIAKKTHHCCGCGVDIEPGDEYEGIVYANKGQGIVVIKQHIYPPCDDPLEDLEENELEAVLK